MFPYLKTKKLTEPSWLDSWKPRQFTTLTILDIIVNAYITFHKTD